MVRRAACLDGGGCLRNHNALQANEHSTLRVGCGCSHFFFFLFLLFFEGEAIFVRTVALGSKTLPKFKTNKHLIRIPLPPNLDNPSTVHLGTNDKLDTQTSSYECVFTCVGHTIVFLWISKWKTEMTKSP